MRGAREMTTDSASWMVGGVGGESMRHLGIRSKDGEKDTAGVSQAIGCNNKEPDCKAGKVVQWLKIG